MLITDAWDYILDVARERLVANFHRHNSHRLGDHIEVLGVAGELAARRFLGLPERVLGVGDPGWDIEIPSTDVLGDPYVWTIDVKSRPWIEGFWRMPLQWPLHKPMRADLALLVFVHLAERRAAVVSFAGKEDLEAAPIDTGGLMPCRLVDPQNMQPATRLYNLFCTVPEWMSEDACLTPEMVGLESDLSLEAGGKK